MKLEMKQSWLASQHIAWAGTASSMRWIGGHWDSTLMMWGLMPRGEHLKWCGACRIWLKLRHRQPTDLQIKGKYNKSKNKMHQNTAWHWLGMPLHYSQYSIIHTPYIVFVHWMPDALPWGPAGGASKPGPCWWLHAGASINIWKNRDGELKIWKLTFSISCCTWNRHLHCLLVLLHDRKYMKVCSPWSMAAPALCVVLSLNAELLTVRSASNPTWSHHQVGAHRNLSPSESPKAPTLIQ